MRYGLDGDDSDYASDRSLESRSSARGGRRMRKEGKAREQSHDERRSRRTPPGKSDVASRSKDTLDIFVRGKEKSRNAKGADKGGKSSGSSPGSEGGERQRKGKVRTSKSNEEKKSERHNDADGNRNRKQSRGSQILSTLTQLLTQTMRLSPAAPETDAETVTMAKGTSITEIEEIDLAPADNGDFMAGPGGKSTRNVSPARRHHWDDEDA